MIRVSATILLFGVVVAMILLLFPLQDAYMRKCKKQKNILCFIKIRDIMRFGFIALIIARFER